MGHFDHYICRADDRRRGRGHTEVPDMLRVQLLKQGVEDSAIEIVPDEVEAVSAAMGMASEGDLVVLFADDVRRSWNQVIQWEGSGAASMESAEPKPVHSFVEEDPEAFSLDPGARLVRDERGVRLAKDEESD
jgi:cyanophycin synthetase